MHKKRNIYYTTGKTFFYACLLWCNTTYGQTVFFSTKIPFEEKQLSNFYSSVSVSGNHVLFNANDYKLHCFNKQTGAEEWSFYGSRKSNDAPQFYKSTLITGMYEDEVPKAILLDIRTGKLLQTLSVGPLLTAPIFKDNMMYGTALHDGGKLFAYDLKENKIIWEQFIAHGVEAQPYYFRDKIVANAEGSNWFEMNYAGKFLQTGCYTKAQLFIENIKCVRHFKFLTHDDRDITESYAEKYFGSDEYIKENHDTACTVLFDGVKLMILGNDKKILKQTEIKTIIKYAKPDSFYYKIIKFNKEKLWLMGEGILTVYDYKADKILNTYDLGKWQPQTVIMDENKIWLVSERDGQLYGLNTD